MKSTSRRSAQDANSRRQTSFVALYKLLLPLLRGNWPTIILSMLALCAVVVTEMGVPLIYRSTIDFFAMDPTDDETVRSFIGNKAIQYVLLLIGILVFSYFQNFLMQKAGQTMMVNLRKKVFDFLLVQNMRFFHSHKLGSILSRVTSDIEGIQQLFSTVLSGLARNVATIIGVIVTMLFIDINLTLYTVGALILFLPIVWYFSKKVRNITFTVRTSLSQLNSYLSEHINGLETVRSFSQEHRDMSEFSDHNTHLYNHMKKEVYTIAVFRPLIDLATAIATVYMFSLSAYLQSQNVLTIGVTVAFLNLISRFFQQLNGVSESLLAIQNAHSGLEKVYLFLQQTTAISEDTIDIARTPLPPIPSSQTDLRTQQHRSSNTATSVVGSVLFDHVWFAYTKKNYVLKDICFEIKPGTTTAIVGYTGSGKSTVANLLSRLWSPSKGTITINGNDIDTISNHRFRKKISIINQNITLFDGTIASNIALSDTYDLKKIAEIGKMVNIDTFIDYFSDGYETVIDDNAMNSISVGQKQLIAFARVIAQAPEIIILDEATAHIDSKTERSIQMALEVVLKNRSALIIAHRLSTVQHATEIISLANGSIIERGTHSQLLLQKGYYYQLWKYQHPHHDG